jgi:hypothetical protein
VAGVPASPSVSRASRRRSARAAEKAPRPSALAAALEKRRKEVAFHEAAHAVVGVRLGLPLASVDIRARGAEQLDAYVHEATLPGRPVTSAEGGAVLVPGAVEQWNETITDLDTRDRFVRLAAMAAGGVVAEMEMGKGVNDPAHRADIVSIVHIAATLGIGRATVEKPVENFINAAFKRAAEVLNEDGGRGWRAVAAALLKSETLSADEVGAVLRREARG